MDGMYGMPYLAAAMLGRRRWRAGRKWGDVCIRVSATLASHVHTTLPVVYPRFYYVQCGTAASIGATRIIAHGRTTQTLA